LEGAEPIVPKWIGWSFLGVAAAALTVIGAAQSCSSAVHDEFVLRETADLRRRTIPPNADVLRAGDLARRPYAVEASWDFQTQLDWAEYAKSVEAKLSAGYRCTGATADALVFSRHQSGDAVCVRVERLSDGPPLRVRVIYQGQPD
jgi:hypothetical protein